MAVREVRASGLASRGLATELLQRARVTDPEAGLWEAADLQWWWRTPRRSDAIDQVARGLYIGAGFRVTSTTRSYGWAQRSLASATVVL
jgi:hypothetical protein